MSDQSGVDAVDVTTLVEGTLVTMDPERRTLTLRQIRSHVQDHVDGVGHEYRRDTLWTNALWLYGAHEQFADLGQALQTLLGLCD